ncbi:hypothetical protein SO802_009419 [Lithocarpus litseifolius]|uniref:Transposase n=1 Tax=Lithocarpus litseifolius TaxID=425828 RepID=A0AAW2DBW2_9ROSI
MDETIVKVRKSVRYVRSSPQRQCTFNLCAEKEKVGFKSQLCLDVPTRWNYTYLMLEKAEGKNKAILVSLYDAYTQNQVESSSASATAQAQGQKPSGSMERDDSSVVMDVKAMRDDGI